MGRAPCCEKDSVKRGPWTPEEDAKLLACIGQYGTGSWRTLPKKAGLQRCGKSCRLRWTNYLRPDLKHGRFSDQEEQLIVKLHAALGSRWSLIAAQLPGRTDNDVKNYWNTRLKKKLCEMGIDPITHKPISQLLADLAGSMTLPKGSEIAEATLGCFKDDMLNVLMRKRSDAHHTLTMSFAPLTLPPPPPVPPPNHDLIMSSPASPSAPTNLDHSPAFQTPPAAPYHSDHHHPSMFLHHSANRDHSLLNKKPTPTPSPCGPVSGIRSLASRSNPPPYYTHDSSLSFFNHPSQAPPPVHGFDFSAHLSPLCSPSIVPFHHTRNLNDPSSCMLDLLLDQASYAPQAKEVPDLNLMNDHQLQVAMNGRITSSDQEITDVANPAGDTGATDPVNAGAELGVALQAGGQQAGSGTQPPDEDELQASMQKQMEQNKGSAMAAHYAEEETGHHSVGVDQLMRAPRMMQEWSPISYTNSGSSSSNLSLSATPVQHQHQNISPLDSVLTSDSLLWDLSELGSMVS